MSRKISAIITTDGLLYTTKRAFAWWISHLPFDLGKKFSFKFVNNSRLVFSPAGLTYSLFAGQNKIADHGEFKLLSTYVSQGSTVCDVGANIGSHSIVAATLAGPTGKVFTFEPSPRFADFINRNITCNNFQDRVILFPIAVGESEAMVHLNEDVADDSTNNISSSGTAVQQRRLDDCIPGEISSIDFLKIDVEGYEENVLAGAQKTLSKTKVIYIEFITDPSLPQCLKHPKKVIETLTTYFELYQYNWETEELTPFSYDSNKTYSLNLVGLRL